MNKRKNAAMFLSAALLAACSFNYDISGEETNEPDIVMKDVDYVRMQNAHPFVQFKAKEVRRYEKNHSMEMDDFSFEQFNSVPPGSTEDPEVNVRGTGALVKLQTDTGNANIEGGVTIEVISEEITIKTPGLSWQNEERLLTAPRTVELSKPDGTTMSGENFSADIRRRSWQFENNVKGAIVETENGNGNTSGNAAEENFTEHYD